MVRHFTANITNTEDMIEAARKVVWYYNHYDDLKENGGSAAGIAIAERAYKDQVSALYDALYEANPQLNTPIFTQRAETKTLIEQLFQNLFDALAVEMGVPAPTVNITTSLQ